MVSYVYKYNCNNIVLSRDFGYRVAKFYYEGELEKCKRELEEREDELKQLCCTNKKQGKI